MIGVSIATGQIEFDMRRDGYTIQGQGKHSSHLGHGPTKVLDL